MAKTPVTKSAMVSFVQVQTLRGNQGTPAAFAEVEKVVAAHNAATKSKHVAELVTQMPNNTKGMQFQLGLLATVARANGVTMVRLGVHNGHVALCGPLAAVEATRLDMMSATNLYTTMVASAYVPSIHKSRVGFTNGYLCGTPAGLQTALGIVPTLAYGLGFLYTFQAPGDGTAYAIGFAAALEVGKPATTKAERKTRNAKPAATDAPVTDAPATDAPVTDAVAA